MRNQTKKIPSDKMFTSITRIYPFLCIFHTCNYLNIVVPIESLNIYTSPTAMIPSQHNDCTKERMSSNKL